MTRTSYTSHVATAAIKFATTDAFAIMAAAFDLATQVPSRLRSTDRAVMSIETILQNKRTPTVTITAVAVKPMKITNRGAGCV